MLIVDNYKIYAIKEGGIRVQIDALELSGKTLPYFRVIKDNKPKRNQYGLLLAGKPIPTTIEGKKFKELNLEIGYYDTDTLELEQGEIKIGHVIIEEVDYWEYTKPEEEKGYCYKFHLKVENGATTIYEHDGSIKTFIGNVLNKINKELDSGKSFAEINLDYFKECIRDWEWDIHHNYFNPYNSILSMVYNSKMVRKETFHSPYGSCYGIIIDMDSPYMYNPYIFWMLSQTVSDLKFITKGKQRHYVGLITSLPEYIKKELELGDIIYPDHRWHVELVLLSGIISNFNKDYCRNGWESLSPVWEQTEYRSPHISSNLYNHYCIFRNMKCWHYIRGEYRVGRDDREWPVDTYSIPVYAGCKIMDEVLDALKNDLNVDLSFQEDNQRYYCNICGESEYIGGMAETRGGPIDNDNIVFQFLKVMLDKGI